MRHTSTLTLTADYALQIITALSWLAVLKLACVCSREIRAAVKAGERIDRVDDAFARLDALHVELFGCCDE